MEVEVEYVLNQILQNLSVERGHNELDSFKGLKCGYKNLKSSLDDEDVLTKYLHGSDTYISPQQNESTSTLNLSENEIQNMRSRKLSNEYQGTDTSSGFVDLITTKETCNNNFSDDFTQRATNDSITTTETGEILDSPSNDVNVINRNQVCRIITSTPKKEVNDKAMFYGSFRETLANNADSFTENALNQSYEKDDEYLNTTIDEAISKYERNEEKFKEVFVQTSFEDFCENCCSCSNNFQTEKQKDSAATKIESPHKKKIKIEKNSGTPFTNVEIALELKNSELSRTPEKICRNEQMTILINQFPLKGL